MRKLLSSILTILILSLSGSAFAATVTVDTTQDQFDNAAPCSLREAIQSVNDNSAVTGCNTSGGGDIDTVVFQDPDNIFILDIPPAGQPNDDNTDGDLDICENITIQGGGAGITIIRANFPAQTPDRVIHTMVSCDRGGGSGVNGQGGIPSVNIDGVTIENGTVSPITGSRVGGGGIYNERQVILNLSNSVVQNNGGDEGTSGESVVVGGGIFNDGFMNIIDSDIRDNVISFSDPDNGYAVGGGIASGLPGVPEVAGDPEGQGNECGPVTISSTNINGNRVTNGGGGGIYNIRCSMEILMSAVYDNHVDGAESGIFIPSGGPLMGSGGGIANLATSSLGDELEFIDSTLSGNTAVLHGGGHYDRVQEGMVRYSSSTVASNMADSNDNGAGNGGGWYRAEFSTSSLPTTFNFQNTIVANNLRFDQPDDCFSFPQSVPPPYTSVDYNLVQDTSACVIDGTTTNNLPVGTDPLLGMLMNNGGRTLTHALDPNSPGIDTGNNVAGCTDDIDTNPFPPIPSGAVLPFDQRDDPFLRTVAGTIGGVARCDIGAYEFVPTTITGQKDVSDSIVAIGDVFTYTITVTNEGPGQATNVMIVDNLPAEVAFDSFGTISQGTCNHNAGVVTCDIGVLAANASATVEINVEAIADGTVVNEAIITTNETDPNTPDVTNEVTTQIVSALCLSGSGHFFSTLRTGCAGCGLNKTAHPAGILMDYAPYLGLGLMLLSGLWLRRRKQD